MKTFKNQILLTMIVLSSCFAHAHEPATFSLLSFKNIENAATIVADLNGEITSTTWDKDYMLIELEIKTDNVNLAVAKHLVSVERYCIEMRLQENGNLVLLMPNIHLSASINGEPLSESITCHIYVPEGVTVKVIAADQLIPCPPGNKPLANLIDDAKNTLSAEDIKQDTSSF